MSALGKPHPQKAPQPCDGESLQLRTASILQVWGRKPQHHCLPGFLPAGWNWAFRTNPSRPQKCLQQPHRVDRAQWWLGTVPSEREWATLEVGQSWVEKHVKRGHLLSILSGKLATWAQNASHSRQQPAREDPVILFFLDFLTGAIFKAALLKYSSHTVHPFKVYTKKKKKTRTGKFHSIHHGCDLCKERKNTSSEPTHPEVGRLWLRSELAYGLCLCRPGTKDGF